MQRYYFNLSCQANYIEDILIGVDAFTPEEAEEQIDAYVTEDKKEVAREFLVTERKLTEPRDFTNVSLVENTEMEEND